MLEPVGLGPLQPHYAIMRRAIFVLKREGLRNSAKSDNVDNVCTNNTTTNTNDT